MGRKRLGDDIFNDLEQKILTGTYGIGKKLPTERELAEEYAVSRVPVRYALSLLTERGYIQTTAGSGSVVISQGDDLFEHEPLILQSTPDVNDVRFLLETIRIRTEIESEAAALAAKNRTAEDIKQIQKALFDSINEIRKLKLKETNSFFEADKAFHTSIIEASKNDFLIRCYSEIPLIITAHQYWSLKFTTPRDEVVSYHTQIYECILDGNEQKARESMQHHLSRVESLLGQKEKEVCM